MVTPIIPASCELMSRWPNSSWVPNGLGNGLILKSQMKPARLLMMANSAMKMTTWLRTSAFCDRLEHDALDQHAGGERDADREEERGPIGQAPLQQLPGDEGREHRHLALREIETVDRLVDHHDRERHAGIDGSGREPGQHLIDEQFHDPDRL